jgi:hypothetical protein
MIARNAAVKGGSRWCVLTGGLVLLVFMALLIDERLWTAFGMRLIQMKPHFADMIAILAAGDARRVGSDVYAVPNPFDPFGRPHVYGPWWLVLGGLGFTVGDGWWMGALLAVSFVIIAVAVLAPCSPARTSLAVGLLISPPVMLGLERANNDLVVFLLIAASAWMVATWPRVGVLAAVAVVCLAAALKIYPVAALAALPAARCRPRAALALVAAGIVGCIALGFWYRADFARVLALIPKELSVFTYGLKVLLELFKATFSQWYFGFGIAAGLAFGGWFLGSQLRKLWNHVPLQGGTAFAYVGGASCWIFCYFSNTNFSYRAVLLLLPARLWFRDSDTRENGMLSRRWLALLLLLLWMTCASGNLHDWIGRDRKALLPLWCVVVSFEHSLVLVVTAALLVSLVGWAVRHWRRGFLKPVNTEKSYLS